VTRFNIKTRVLSWGRLVESIEAAEVGVVGYGGKDFEKRNVFS